MKITQGPEERSKQTKPTFEGEASETEPVTVHIYEGAGTAGTEVASLPATVSGEHKWHVTVDDRARGREVHGPGDGAELDRQRDGQERTAADVRSLHETADGDDGSAEGTVERKQTEVQGHGQRTGPGDGARLQGQRSERHRSGEIDRDGGGQRRMVGLAEPRRCRTKPTRRWRPSRARSATKKARANRRGRSKSSRSRRRSRWKPLKRRSKENKPTFKGTASEPGQVTVHVFKGKEAKGTEVVIVDGHGGGERRMVGRAGDGTCRTEPTRPWRPSRARSAMKKGKANRRGRSKSTQSPRR